MSRNDDEENGRPHEERRGNEEGSKPAQDDRRATDDWQSENDGPPEAYADVTLPGQSSDNGAGQNRSAAGETSDPESELDDWHAPPQLREPLLRDRIRDRLGVTPKQWYVIETFLLVLPYAFFIAIYLSFNVNETLFLAVTLVYSLVAAYIGFLS